RPWEYGWNRDTYVVGLLTRAAGGGLKNPGASLHFLCASASFLFVDVVFEFLDHLHYETSRRQTTLCFIRCVVAFRGPINRNKPIIIIGEFDRQLRACIVWCTLNAHAFTNIL